MAAANMEGKGETKLCQVLAKVCSDEKYHDVVLQGSDGVKVSSCRNILAARSEVFDRMLFGSFSEAKGRGDNDEPIKLGYEGDVLQAIVEYIYTDAAELLGSGSSNKKRKHQECGDYSFYRRRIPQLLSLYCAAEYFMLSGLAKKVEDTIDNMLGEKPSVSFLLLEACKEGTAVFAPLLQAAWRGVRSLRRLKAEVIGQAVAGLSASVLEEILQEKKVHMTELQLFEILCLWMEAKPTARKPLAAGLVNHICLEKINPSSLSTVIATSGLVTTHQLAEAYKKQSLAHEKSKPIGYDQLRLDPVWQGSLTTDAYGETFNYKTDSLKVSPMKSGLHQWTLLVKDMTCAIVVGIVARGSPSPLGCEFLGRGPGSFGLGGSGTAYRVDYSGKLVQKGSVTRGIREGDKLTFTLDLRHGNESNGTLHVSFEGQSDSKKLLFSKLKSQLVEYPEGFVPAVSLYDDSHVRLLSIDMLEE